MQKSHKFQSVLDELIYIVTQQKIPPENAKIQEHKEVFKLYAGKESTDEGISRICHKLNKQFLAPQKGQTIHINSWVNLTLFIRLIGEFNGLLYALNILLLMLMTDDYLWEKIKKINCWSVFIDRMVFIIDSHCLIEIFLVFRFLFCWETFFLFNFFGQSEFSANFLTNSDRFWQPKPIVFGRENQLKRCKSRIKGTLNSK